MKHTNAKAQQLFAYFEKLRPTAENLDGVREEQQKFLIQRELTPKWREHMVSLVDKINQSILREEEFDFLPFQEMEKPSTEYQYVTQSIRASTLIQENFDPQTEMTKATVCRLSQMSLPISSGEILFGECCENFVHISREISEVEEVNYLKGCLGGKALAICQGVPPLTANYNASWYTGKKKVYMLILVTLLTVMAFTLLTVVTYFVVDAVVVKKSDHILTIQFESGPYSKAAVASNGYLCAKIGKDILEENGTAVDAAIATMICEGVICFQSMGIGGGFMMTIYEKKSGNVDVLNARETAPAKAFENMFSKNATASEKGGLAVAVPGELKGYHEAYLKYGGGVPWKRLFEPSIKICKEGFRVHRYLADHIDRYRTDILETPCLREILFNTTTNKLAVEGDLIQRPDLGRFLQIIADEGVAPFYEGGLAKEIVAEVKAQGGILSEEDLRNYKVQWMRPVKINWGPYEMYSSPVPGSGELLAFMLNMLRGFIPVSDGKTATQRFIEVFKWGYGKRTELGDFSRENFVPNASHVRQVLRNLTSESYAREIRQKIKDDRTSQDPKYYGAKAYPTNDHGTCHISVLAANGDAVSVTSTVNLVFGAKFISKSTGILFNNQMADFSAPHITNPFGIPPSPANYIRAGKRPLSSMCPTIFLNENNDVSLVIGASGGSRITSTVAYVAYNTLLGNMGIKEAIDLPRLHHQLFPMEADYETGYPEEYIKRLQEIGHKTQETAVTVTSTVTSIRRINGKITPSYDYRRGGSVDGY